MTFPIKTGDTCLINFSQFGYDHWLYNDEDSAGVRSDGQPQTWTERRFSLRDGFAQVGYNTIPKAIADYSELDSEWRNVDRTVMVTLADAGVNIVAGTSTINISKDGNVTITAPTTAIVGDLTVTGSVVATGEVTGNGIALSTHTHAVLAADFGNTDVPS